MSLIGKLTIDRSGRLCQITHRDRWGRYDLCEWDGYGRTASWWPRTLCPETERMILQGLALKRSARNLHDSSWWTAQTLTPEQADCLWTQLRQEADIEQPRTRSCAGREAAAET